MNASITIDDREFQRTLIKYLAVTKHTLAYALNKKMYFIVKGAMEGTPVASREAIQKVFNVTQTERIGKNGKVRRTTNYGGMNSSAFALAQWKRKQKGLAPFTPNVPVAEARKVITSRLRAVGSLKNGWRGAYAKYGRILSEPVTLAYKARVKAGSQAEPAKDGFSPAATATYRLNIRRGEEQLIDPRVVAALSSAFNAETSSMEKYLTDKMQKDADAVNAK